MSVLMCCPTKVLFICSLVKGARLNNSKKNSSWENISSYERRQLQIEGKDSSVQKQYR